MVGPVLRAGAWPAVAGVSGAAVVVGGCGIAFPAAAVLFPICFALLAAAAAFTLDEPASLVVDVTPTGPVRRTRIRSLALLAPFAAGALVMLAAAMRGLALPWTGAGLALAGNVLLGFAAACVARTRTGEPGAATGTAVVLILMAPSLLPQVPAGSARSRHPAAGCRRTPCGGPSSPSAWPPSPSRSVAEACPGGCPVFRDPGDDDPGDTDHAGPGTCSSARTSPVPRSGRRPRSRLADHALLRLHVTDVTPADG
jgi:hypothetical protein